MRIATIDTGSNGSQVPALALVTQDLAVPVGDLLAARGHDWRDLGQVLAATDGLDVLRAVAAQAAERAGRGEGIAIADARFLPPVLKPARILAVAANYRAHVRETGTIEDAAREETAPWFFDMPQYSMNPHDAPIILPKAMGRSVDWEAELGVVIGRPCRDVTVEEALSYVMGYTVINDISARAMEVEGRTKIRERDKFHDWLHGKWFDTFCCVGPWVVTADEIADPQNLTLSLTLNGERRQHASTGDMLFTVAELISFASQIMTLQPGDLLATGTPSGVGKAAGRFLTAGDVVVASVEGVGALRNPVAAHA